MEKSTDPGQRIVEGHPNAGTQGIGDQGDLGIIHDLHIRHSNNDFHGPSD
jgi:hypothetical protein